MAEFKVANLTEKLTVSGQPGAPDFAALAAQGVTTIINNRPDGEQLGQISAAEGARLAAESGMGYRHIPITLQAITDADVSAFAGALTQATGPVHAHCRSGIRSATLWALSAVTTGTLGPAQAKSAIEAAGFDAGPAMTWLAARGAVSV